MQVREMKECYDPTIEDIAYTQTKVFFNIFTDLSILNLRDPLKFLLIYLMLFLNFAFIQF